MDIKQIIIRKGVTVNMSKKQNEKNNGEAVTKDKSSSKKNKVKYANNSEIIEYCINHNLLYELMVWLEVDLDTQILRGGVIKKFKTTLGTDGYYFVSLDPSKKNVIKEMDISDEEYGDYIRGLYNELSVYLTESESKEGSAKDIFGRYVYNKLNKIKSEDIDLYAFVKHIKRFKSEIDRLNANVESINIGDQ